MDWEEAPPLRRKEKKITQRLIVPGGQDRVISPPMSQTAFARLRGSSEIWFDRSRSDGFVTKSECFWDEREQTISLWPEVAREIFGHEE
jgi:hypothetical protein